MNIPVAEDEKDTALLYKKALEVRNHRVTVTSNGEDCLKAYHDVFQEMISSGAAIMKHFQLPFDVVLLDYKMPQINGLEVAKEILAVNSHQGDIYLHVKMQEHRAIIEFLEKRIAQLEDSSLEVAEEIRHFSDDMRNHFSEEEEIVFPLALKANSSS